MTSGDSLYAWQVQEPDGQWSMVGAAISADPDAMMPLIHRRLDLVLQFVDVAKAHAAATGQPLRLAHFKLEKVLAS